MFPARPAKRGSGIGERVWTGVNGEVSKFFFFFFFFFFKNIYLGRYVCIITYVRMLDFCNNSVCWNNYLFYIIYI